MPTITFHLTDPDPDFLYKLALPFADAVPADTPFKPVDASPFIPATGPYMIHSYTPEVTNKKSGAVETIGKIELVRNPYFVQWSQAAQPEGYPDQIDGSLGISPAQQVSKVEQGQLDVTGDSPPADQLSHLDTRFRSQLYDVCFLRLTGS